MEVIDALMPLSKIDIGHDNSGAGPGWHLDRVNIRAIHERVCFPTICNEHRYLPVLGMF